MTAPLDGRDQISVKAGSYQGRPEEPVKSSRAS